MQIQLKQVEIIAALKQYIAQQGIGLTGKQININFTAGRKESGITADISIEDVDVPDFFVQEKDPVALTLISNPINETKATAVVPEPEVAEAPKSISLFS